MEKSLLTVEDLRISYVYNNKKINIINCLSFELEKGEILGICGPSGCGKTTLLKAVVCDKFSNFEVLGKMSFCSTQYYLNGLICEDSLKSFMFVPQVTGSSVSQIHKLKTIYADLCVSRNLDSKKMIKKLKEVLTAIDVEADMLNAYPFQLSGGMLQRMLIAFGVSIEPEILLLDEPTSALDKETQRKVVDSLRGLAKRGTAVIVVSHEDEFLNLLGSRLIYVEGV